MIRSIPVQAVPLGLFDIPAEILPEVNRWFADHAVGHNFTISVVAQEEKGKFIVELFDGSLNVNEKARERMAEMKQQLTDQQLPNSSKLTTAPNVPQELMEVSELTKTTQQNRVHSMFARDDLQMGSNSTPDTSTPKSFDEGNTPALEAIIEHKENVTETSVQSYKSDSEVAQVLKEEVYASCIVGPNYFWCQYSNTEDLNTVSKLAQEAGQIQQDSIFLERLEPGSPCLALFSSDNQWYRAQVILKAGNTLHVVFIDYGNESEVDIENVRSLPQSLLDIAPQAFMCHLKDFNESKGSWNDEVYDDFYNLLINKPLKVTIFNMEGHSEIAVPQYAVEIECDKVVINRLMQKYWRPFSTEQSKNETPLKETQDTETGGNYINTEDLCKVIQLAQEAGQSDQDMTFAETLGPGSPCLALFSSDNQWYRAQVIRRVNDAFCVLFVDYGNESEVDIKDVRSLPQSLLEIAPQAFLCRLNGFNESKGSWDDKASDGFYNLLVDKPLKLTVFSVEDHPEIEVSQFSVEIDYEGMVVNVAMQKYWKPLTEECLMMENPQSPRGNVSTCMYKEPSISKSKTEMVYASCIAEPHFFWCQYTNTEDLCKVIQLAQEAGQSDQDLSLTETLVPGSPCLALFSSDNQWYRAQVMRKTDNTLHVLFVDYGNESEIDIKDVRSLPQSLLEIAPQAFLCCLDGFDESKGSWDDLVYDDFYNLLIDKQLKLTVCNMKDHPEIAVPHYAVKIEDERVVVNATVQKYWKPVTKECLMTENSQCPQGNESACTYKEPRISVNKMVHASYIVEPHFFWCQYTITEDLCKVIQEAGQSDQDMTFTETLGPGSPCLALFSSDNQWYRAQVIQKTDKTLRVLFVDYGNDVEVDIKDVRSLPQSLLEIAPQAFLCHLDGFDKSKGSWDDETSAEFYNLLIDKPLKLTVLNVENHSKLAVLHYAVEIECAGVVVNAAMQKYWKPVTEECAVTESPQREIVPQGGPVECRMTHGNESTCMYKEPSISKNKAEMVYASCIAEPHFFWCQYTNTEDLCKVIQLAQEAGQSDQDLSLTETLVPGSPCLALFSSDNQWYRAQVMQKTDNTLHVLFVDYGNESEVDIKDVRSLPQTLLEIAPQAFLCRLNGFDESKGSWQDEVYDDFYNLLIDKQLKVTVVSAEDHSEIAVPHYAVEIECEGAVVNTLMKKYWNGEGSDGALLENLETADRDETRTVDENVEV
ncbi:tudor domain-containing protein 1 [Acanthochromis polyacanthus]|uniref:tudor domain-containing protein 1 n=1 Tax=Acanthochromis polyacanthus TaxID=80966 RepID=UPI002233F330|nr:tudor domain-containing protein 1 [Acanthochromis polyacanthus]